MPLLPHDFWSFIRYFKPHEFSSPDDPITCNSMDYRLVIALDNIRYFLHEIIEINSGYRTAKHNQDIGANSDSAHLKGYAVDIKAGGDKYRHSLLFLVMNLGINRIGIYPEHIHLDVDPDKTPGVFWYGTEKQIIN